MKKQLISSILSAGLALSTFATTVSATGFSDVNTNNWFYTAVHTATERSFFSGYNDGSFKPNTEITGGELAVVLANAFYPTQLAYEQENWIGKGDWYTPYVNTLKAFAQEDSAVFTIDFQAPITRAETASLLYDAMKVHLSGVLTEEEAMNLVLNRYAVTSDFSPYHIAVGNVIESGFMSGVSDSSFGGSGNLTRAQAAVIIVNMDNTGSFTQDVGTSTAVSPDLTRQNLNRKYSDGEYWMELAGLSYVMSTDSVVEDIGDAYIFDLVVRGPIHFNTSYIDNLKAGSYFSATNGYFYGHPISTTTMALSENILNTTVTSVDRYINTYNDKVNVEVYTEESEYFPLYFTISDENPAQYSFYAMKMGAWENCILDRGRLTVPKDVLFEFMGYSEGKIPYTLSSLVAGYLNGDNWMDESVAIVVENGIVTKFTAGGPAQ